jgi:hypothetical protein
MGKRRRRRKRRLEGREEKRTMLLGKYQAGLSSVAAICFPHVNI